MNENIKHTKEPWAIYPSKNAASFGFQHSPNRFVTLGACYGRVTYQPIDRANAQRIVACVNACEGIEHPEQFVMNALVNADRILQYQAERDEVLSSLKEIANFVDNDFPPKVALGKRSKEYTFAWAKMKEVIKKYNT